MITRGKRSSRGRSRWREPSSWPVLVHCHASMDRSPAWMGLYRFVVEGWTLADAFREIEHHRGLRPKASVILLYNRVLPLLAPERCALDPTAALLQTSRRGNGRPDDSSGNGGLGGLAGETCPRLGQNDVTESGEITLEPARSRASSSPAASLVSGRENR